jgi:Ca2+-binding RTX toxin-like protein
MARLIGTVRQVVGDVFAVAGDGSRRAVVEGDRLFAGERLQTGADGAVAVHLAAGGDLTLGRDSSLTLTTQMLSQHAAHIDTQDALPPTLAELMQAQQAMAPGVESAPASEAATGPASSSSALGGGHSAVVLSETGGAVNPVIGFATSGFNSVPEYPLGYLDGVRDSAPDAPPAFVPPISEPPADMPVVVVPPLEPPVEPPIEPPLEPPLEPPVIPEPPLEPPVEPPVEPPSEPEPPVEPPINHGVQLSGGALTFNEANLPCGSASDPSALTQTGTFTVLAVDGLRALTVGGIVVVSGGVIADYSQPVTTPLGNTFSVIGYDPATGEVSYSYTLTGPATHADGDGANSLGEQITVIATDADTDSATSTLDISIVDDLPQAATIDVTLSREPLCSNLLLVVDNSQSMKDPSGVDGLSRLELAKQAISELLDRYQAMGDVKVQIVTFNSQADVPSDHWLSVAEAKTFINALEAGNGTHYDAAVAAAQTAFAAPGSLNGGQNLAYFFSDGNPSLSPSHSTPNAQPNPEQGDGISLGEELDWIAFLDSHHINAFAIGLGTDVSNTYLDPLAYDANAGNNTQAVIVTDLGQLSAVLTGTVQGGTTGSLLSGGSFGADGGYIRSVTVDGTTYTYDPNTAAVAREGEGHGSFNDATHDLTIVSDHGGTLVVNLLSGAFSYTPSSTQGSPALTEHISYVISDNDGDLAGANLLIHVTGDVVAPQGPTAMADHIITNILSANIEVPAALLLANDLSANGDPLSATPTLFNTGWEAKGAGFSSDSRKPINFTGVRDQDANQLKNLERSDFFNNSALTALVVISGYLGPAYGAAANAQDLYSVHLKAGESVTVDLRSAGDQIGIGWQMDGGQFQALDAGGTFTASEDNVYRILLVNQPDPGQADAAQHYSLNLSVDYSAADTTPGYESLYTISDAHGGSDSAAVSINYQEGCTLLGTPGDDVLIAGAGDDALHGGDGNDVLSGGAGNNDLYGDNGNDLLFSGPGNEVLDGGAGNNTASYALATAGVTVSTAETGLQDTGGAGCDRLINIQNLMGSNYDDHLTGDSEANVINGGQGNDRLIGGNGNDTLTGGAGHDTFQWLAGETGHDLVTDFTFGADKLDLSQLLQGAGASEGSLDDYLHFKVTGSGADLVSTIEVSSAAGAAATQTIDLAGVDLASHYGVTPGSGGMIAAGVDTASIITGMLSDHSMKADTV